VLPLAPIDIDCCLTSFKKKQLHEIPLEKPHTNILSSGEDLNLAGVKINEIQDLIDREQTKRFEHLKFCQPLGELLYLQLYYLFKYLLLLLLLQML